MFSYFRGVTSQWCFLPKCWTQFQPHFHLDLHTGRHKCVQNSVYAVTCFIFLILVYSLVLYCVFVILVFVCRVANKCCWHGQGLFENCFLDWTFSCLSVFLCKYHTSSSSCSGEVVILFSMCINHYYSMYRNMCMSSAVKVCDQGLRVFFFCFCFFNAEM